MSCDHLFLLPASTAYVLAVSASENQLAVCSVRDHQEDDDDGSGSGIRCREIRLLQNIPQPQNVCLVTKYKALVLCGDRQLKLYDLDSGSLLLKLKGVMNQKMPFFACIDDKNCIALSRNRMTVNILSLESGDLTTTFKVGEDRFLNSLLVSANGCICVCGDETQKPFPLLVWDLNARKLLYDLRLQHHNFVTRLSGISDDAHYLVCVAEELNSQAANFIVVYDLTSGMLFKKWKPGLETISIAVRDRIVASACTDCTIFLWDLASGDKRHQLTGHTSPPDSLRLSPAGLLLSFDSTCSDSVLRIWDTEKGEFYLFSCLLLSCI